MIAKATDNRRVWGFAVLLLMTALAGCDRFDEAAARAHGATLLAPFKQQMKAALQAGMERGPVDSITVCSGQAPAIARALSVDGVVMGRSSHRLRNPATPGRTGWQR